MSERNVTLYRMVLPEHVCPFGLLAKRMLDDAQVSFEDRLLESREEVESFKTDHGVATTPQLFVDGRRIGGSQEIADWLEAALAQG